MMYFAPGYWLAPLRTRSLSLPHTPHRGNSQQSTFEASVPKCRCQYPAHELLMGYFIKKLQGYLQMANYLSMLNGVTISGKVRFCAMLLGTPTCVMANMGSGVITVLPEKSTRFPIKLPRIRPSLPLRRCLTDFRGRPDFCTACFAKKYNLLFYFHDVSAKTLGHAK